MSSTAPEGIPAIRDPDAAHPIATTWRPILREVVLGFVRGDYVLAVGVDHVAPMDASSAEQIRTCIADYGATLVELPEETWETSVAQWMGTHWEVLVDLWTVEEGRSDLVLSAGVAETGEGPRFSIHGVYVP